MLNGMVNLPEDFVYLDQTDPTIIQQMMYYDPRNFVGKKIDGYKANRAVLTKEASTAMKHLQEEVSVKKKNSDYTSACEKKGKKPKAYVIRQKKFLDRTESIDHQRTLVQRLYSCDFCSKQFFTYSQYFNHIRVHTSESSFSCDICYKMFSQKGTRDRHVLAHSGKKQNVCKVCNKSFSRKDDLVKHQGVHTDVKPFACGLCDKSFFHPVQMKRHFINHTRDRPKKYVCDICSKSFAFNQSLIVHKRVHTGEKPYPCPICKKAFAHRISIDRHLLTHTKDRPFKCDFCPKAFSRNTNLQSHLRTHQEKPSEEVDSSDE